MVRGESAKQFILDGDVRVNRKVVTELGTKVNVEEDDVFYRGKKIPSPLKLPRIYILLYKPRGYITSLHDEEGRPTVMQAPAAPDLSGLSRWQTGL